MMIMNNPNARRQKYPMKLTIRDKEKYRLLWSLLPVWVFLFLLLVCWLLSYAVMAAFEIRHLQP